MKFRRLISFFLALLMVTAVPVSVSAENITTVIACSDFQHPSGNSSGKATVKELMGAIKSYGITSADGFLCCGDYNYGSGNTAAGIDALKSAVSDVVSQNMVFVQGNHDEALSANAGLSKSGKNDTDAYGVFVINESDYMRTNSNENTIKKTAQSLIDYLNEKLENEYNKPIFVLSHLPLHYSMRTRNDGDAKHANYIFDALNAAGQKGLNIIFMYGHDHSNGWDDYLGGAAVYLKKGDSILIAQNSQTQFLSKTLEFTYMNAGFVGYYSNVNGADDRLTMTSFKISSTAVEIARYNTLSYHKLKSAGVKNSYKNESGYSPDTTVYTSPQTLTLTAVTDKTPIANLIEVFDPNKAQGERFEKVTDAASLTDGKYLLVYNSSTDYVMTPSVVTKSNGSTYRRGFDIKSRNDVGEEVLVESGLLQQSWTLKKSAGGWQIGDGSKYAKFTSTTDMSVVASLEGAGELFTISGSDGAFEFAGGGYVLNYNSRGLINGFATNPALFYIYRFVGYSVHAENGISEVKSALAGDSVTITANPAPEGKMFDKWQYVTGSGFITDVTESTVTFTMPEGPVKIKATYKDKPHEHTFGTAASDTLAHKATCVAAALYYVKCDSCDEISTEKTVAVGELNVNAHSFSEFVYNNDATCDQNGTETALCDNGCGKSETRLKENTKLTDSAKVFSDVKAGKWYKYYVDYAITFGIFTGTTATTFSPDSNITRAQFVQVLANISGADTSNRNVTTEFSDVPAKKWYTAAVKWASENGVVSGMGDGKFAPDANVTREQMCVMLTKFAEFKSIALKEVEQKQSFADDAKISKWAKNAVYKCQMADIVNGKGEGRFDPQGTGNRAEASVIFTKFHKDYIN